MRKFTIIGYSGHAYVICDAIRSTGDFIENYIDLNEKTINPFGLKYIGSEDVFKKKKLTNEYIVAIGNNRNRSIASKRLFDLTDKHPSIVKHSHSFVSPSASLGQGTFIASGVSINALAKIGDGSICNTACVIEHECQIGEYSHIAPGAVLAGFAEIGSFCFIGANSVIKQGVKIGNNVTVGAGAVIIRDIPSGQTVVGNPSRRIK